MPVRGTCPKSALCDISRGHPGEQTPPRTACNSSWHSFPAESQLPEPHCGPVVEKITPEKESDAMGSSSAWLPTAG